MTLITIRRRTPRRPTAAHSSNRPMWAAALMTVLAGASAVGAQLVWLRVGGGLPPAVALGALLVPGPLAIVPIVSLAAPIVLFLALRFARMTDPRHWVPAWTLGAPWLLLTLTWIAPLSALAIVWLVPIPWVWLGWWPLGSRRPVHRYSRVSVSAQRHRTATPGSRLPCNGCCEPAHNLIWRSPGTTECCSRKGSTYSKVC
jgi:hypothetical protein